LIDLALGLREYFYPPTAVWRARGSTDSTCSNQRTCE